MQIVYSCRKVTTRSQKGDLPVESTVGFSCKRFAPFYDEMNEKLARLCLVSRPSRLMHFGHVSDTKTRSDHVTGRTRQGSPSFLPGTSFLNREEKLLCHVAMVAKFLYDNKPKTSVKKLKSESVPWRFKRHRS